ncbi:uncharacterized protein PV09_07389 [Verruconis gallopava]|uniref:Uncharacterized protein n=1 Tax=Verruconis gallopava TaxID=253628 RepID=A0A0D1YJR7_9PEZI|nr:uncharacterized protein PV09_07389 [Verruconis gallopava]KIW01102.1 hypothetical protein PV09_07389 [Verruconis gallopava]
MAAPVGSSVFFAIALLVICLLVLLLIRYYLPLRSTPEYVLVPVFLALVLPCSIILLVPIDLASHAVTEDETARGIWLPDRPIRVSWRISYWLTFILTWIALPMLGEYCDSGYREPKDRLLYSLRSNARYQLTVLSVGVLGAIYFFINEGFHFNTLKGLVMALAYAWGLILAIYLMGHGMVSIPRRLFHDASVSRRLRRLQSHAPKIWEKLMEATEELQEHEAQVTQLKSRKNGTARDYREWIEDLVDMVATPDTRVTAATAALPAARANVPNVITDRYLADLTRKLKRARHKKLRYLSEWEHLVHLATRTQTILDSNSSRKLDFGKPSAYSPFYERITILTPYTRYLMHTKLIPGLYYLACVITTLASICVIWSEVVHQIGASKFSLIGLTTIHHPNSSRGEIGFAGQFLAAAWLCYMCACALWSITEVKVWGNRALVRRGTYEESACWYAGQVAKLTVPLSYNFVTMMPSKIHEATVFYSFLGQLVDLTPLGKGFSGFFPILVLLPVLANLFGLYKKVRGMFGLDDLIDEEEEIGGWREGRNLIEREIRGHNESVGLTARTEDSPSFNSPRGGSLDFQRPSLRSTVLPSQSSEGRTSTRSSSPRPPRQPRQVASYSDEEEDGNFFTEFAHRVRNTFESADKPVWMIEGFKRPKWLGGQDRGGSGSSEGISRWFGRPPEGRVRL